MAVQFDDLRPYRSLLLATIRTSVPVTQVVNDVLGDVRVLVDEREHSEFHSRIDDTLQNGIRTGMVHYVEERAPGWSTGAVVDRLNQLVIVSRLKRFVAFYVSDSRMRASLARHFANLDFAGLGSLDQLPRDRLNAAFVQGATRTLWLSGTHRRTTVKADSKILTGLNLRDSLDPLDDQTYYFSAARSVPPDLGVPIGVSPRRSTVWAGPSRSWSQFIGGVASLLAHLDATTDLVAQPLPVVATQTADLTGVAGAFDVSLYPPELGADPSIDVETRQELERWAYRSVFEVTNAGPPIQANVFLDGNLLGTLELDLDMSDSDRIVCSATGVPSSQAVADDHDAALRHCQGVRNLKVRYDSGHTLSEGAMFEQRHRDIPFLGFRFVDFAGFHLKKEKPDPVTAVGHDQGSLFDWVHGFWPNLDGTQNLPGGFLASDDGTMEIADFIHLDQNGTVPIISLIHVKAAGSESPDRRISVSSYEVVTGQAVKNLRFLDQLILADGLANGLERVISQVAFFNRAPSTRQDMIDQLQGLGRNFERRVVIVQPHMMRARHDSARANPNSADAARLRQLDTLLIGAEAAVRSLGAEFLVVTAA